MELDIKWLIGSILFFVEGIIGVILYFTFLSTTFLNFGILHIIIGAVCLIFTLKKDLWGEVQPYWYLILTFPFYAIGIWYIVIVILYPPISPDLLYILISSWSLAIYFTYWSIDDIQKKRKKTDQSTE